MDPFSNGITIRTRKALKTWQSPWSGSPIQFCLDKTNLSKGEKAMSRRISTSLISSVCSGPLRPSEGLKHLRKTNFSTTL